MSSLGRDNLASRSLNGSVESWVPDRVTEEQENSVWVEAVKVHEPSCMSPKSAWRAIRRAMARGVASLVMISPYISEEVERIQYKRKASHASSSSSFGDITLSAGENSLLEGTMSSLAPPNASLRSRTPPVRVDTSQGSRGSRRGTADSDPCEGSREADGAIGVVPRGGGISFSFRSTMTSNAGSQRSTTASQRGITVSTTSLDSPSLSSTQTDSGRLSGILAGLRKSHGGSGRINVAPLKSLRRNSSKHGQYNCIVFGSLNMDLKAVVNGSWPEGYSTTRGEFTQQPGGKGANEAVALARLGVTTSMVGLVGKDEQGKWLIQALQHEGVDCSGVHSHAARTGTAVQIVTLKDRRKLNVSCPGANQEVGDKEVAVARSLMSKHAVLLLQLEISCEAMFRIVSIANFMKVPVAFKPSPLPRDDPQRLADARRVLSEGVALCFVNETEATNLLDWKDNLTLVNVDLAEQAAREMLLRWPQLRTVVVTSRVGHVLRERSDGGWLTGTTFGSKAASYAPNAPPLVNRQRSGPASREIAREIPLVCPRYDYEVVDVIGAADSFIGGFIAAQLWGLSAAHSLACASGTGTLSTKKAGAQDSMPTRSELFEFLQHQMPEVAWPNAEERELLGATDAARAAFDEKLLAMQVTTEPCSLFFLHSAALRCDLNAVSELLPPSGSLRSTPAEYISLCFHKTVERLQQHDLFGFSPARRAHECFILSKAASHQASARLLVAAQLLLVPSTWREPDFQALAQRYFPSIGLAGREPALPSGTPPPLEKQRAGGTLLPAAAAAALVAIELLHPDKSPSLAEAEGDAASRLVRRCCCPVLDNKVVEIDSLLTPELITWNKTWGTEERRHATSVADNRSTAEEILASAPQSEASDLREALLSATMQDGCTLLLAAASTGVEDVVRVLLEGEHLSDSDKYATWGGKNALQLAVAAGPSEAHTEISILLLKHTGLLLDLDETPSLEWRSELTMMLSSIRQGGSASAALVAANAGTVFEARYHVRGESSSATLVHAVDLETGKPVALKFISSVERAKMELKVLQMLNAESPDTAPQLLDHFVDSKSGKRVLVLEAADSSVKIINVCKRRNGASELQMRTDAYRLLHCVNALHESGSGFAHCDIKPDHFLRFEGLWRLVDYGSVQEMGQEVACPAHTMPYIAPEVARSVHVGEPLRVTPASDVWACGLVLYELFTGEALLGEEVELVDLALNPHALVVDRLRASSKLTRNQRDILSTMLVVDPESRAHLSELLQRRFFRPGQTTTELRQVTLLGLFSCPKLAIAGGKRVALPQLDLLKEMRNTVQALPRWERELRPAARFPEDIERVLFHKGMFGLSPRILHFSGHGDAGKGWLASGRKDLDGALCFESEDGTPHLPTPEEFIALVSRATAVNKRLECVFLNGCQTYQPLGEAIHREFPFLTVLAWSTVVVDKAAAAFATGFYTKLGEDCSRGREGAISDAVDAAEAAFSAANFRRGDPSLHVPGLPAAGATQHGGHGMYQILRSQNYGSLATKQRNSSVISLNGRKSRVSVRRKSGDGGIRSPRPDSSPMRRSSSAGARLFHTVDESERSEAVVTAD